MKWKTPNHRPSGRDDRKTKKAFAWLPTKLTDDTTVWLEYYEKYYVPWVDGWVTDDVKMIDIEIYKWYHKENRPL